jgi:glycosyltransferase involved in cell wall biosynthesis
MDPITEPYMLLTFIACFIDNQGNIWLEELWHKDFVAHMAFIKNIWLVAPSLKNKSEGWVKVNVPSDARLTYIRLPHVSSLKEAILSLPITILQISSAIRHCKFVHSGVIGWPIPLGWIANSLAMLMHRKLILVIESDMWSGLDKENPSWAHRVRARCTEGLARFFVNHADICFFTHKGYERSLVIRSRVKSLVVPAVWIEEKDIIQKEEIDLRLIRVSEVRVLLAARLVEDKGIRVFLDALTLLDCGELSAQFSIIGDGPLLDLCHAASRALKHIRLDVLTPVKYGKDFFNVIKWHHLVVIPSISDEQPRILFDSYAQGVPVLASDSEGLSSYIDENQTGMLFERGNARDLAKKLRNIIESPQILERWSYAAAAKAQLYSHTGMHLARVRAIQSLSD